MKTHQNHRQKRPRSNADAVAENDGTASFLPPPFKLTAEPVEVPMSQTVTQRKEQEEQQQQDTNLNSLTKANIQVKSGDNLENLVKKHYPDYDYTTGNDRRAIVEATYRLNEHDPKSAIYLTEDDRSIPEWAKDVIDPGMAEQRKIYRTAQLRADATLRLPKVSYIDMLRSTGELGQREDWMNDAIGLSKGIAGFTEGVGAGFLSTAGSTVEGLWGMLKSVLTGEIVGQAVKLYKQLEEMGVAGIFQALKEMGLSLVDQFMDAWNNPNPYEKWRFMGKIVGAVVFEVILAWATMGVGTAIRGSAFFQKFASKFGDMAAWMGKRLEGLKNRLTSKKEEIIEAGIKLPATKGRWSGNRGNSKWFSDKAEVNEIIKGEGITYKNGYPDFSKWSKGSFEIENLTGINHKDFSLVYKKMMQDWGFPNQKAAKDWLKENQITLHHHQNGSTIQLIPSNLHKNVPHTGGASRLRSQ